MTNNDLTLIAESIRSLDLDSIARRSAAEVFADNLRDADASFDRDRFIRACLREEDK